MTIPSILEMNEQLNQLNKFFMQQTQNFQEKISQHQGKFNNSDYEQFEGIIQEIKSYALRKITDFFQKKLTKNSTIYDSQVSTYVDESQKVHEDLIEFRQNLEKATIEMKKQQHRKEILMEHFSIRFRDNAIMKKSLRLLKNNKIERQITKVQNLRMESIYHKNLYKKAFFPWRTLTYKEGYRNTVRKQTEKDMLNIHEQYQSIIDILKGKINETDQIIKLKKAAKGQFAYALSKNLLKTISNLSLQVMSLNQMSLRDGQWSQQNTHNFMHEVDTVIKQKLTKVRQYRKGLIQSESSQMEGQEIIEKKKKKITFI